MESLFLTFDVVTVTTVCRCLRKQFCVTASEGMLANQHTPPPHAVS